ncbi:MAG: hypothetical protein HY744_12005 [Deltaproteobacteria bacterium]|nr:hypothetical protein [Deltaproteobacteria bacterium]
MTTREELSPLFTEVPLSADEASAIVAALRDIAKVDGEHPEELKLIDGFVKAVHADLGEEKPARREKMKPALLAQRLVDPTVRTVAVQCGVLLALADGAISDQERVRLGEYAAALGVAPAELEKIERVLTGWMRSGDLGPLFG